MDCDFKGLMLPHTRAQTLTNDLVLNHVDKASLTNGQLESNQNPINRIGQMQEPTLKKLQYYISLASGNGNGSAQIFSKSTGEKPKAKLKWNYKSATNKLLEEQPPPFGLVVSSNP